MNDLPEIPKKKKGKVYLVVTGNYREFNDFCKMKMWEYDAGFEYFEGCDFVYYSSPDSIRGLLFDGLMYGGTWRSRKDIDFQYIEMILSRNLDR